MCAYAVILAGGSLLEAQSKHELHTVHMRDVVEPGSHYISGIVTMKSSCDELILETKKLSEETILLDFRTWSNPAISCEDVPTPRFFAKKVYAPAVGIHFVATLDMAPLPLMITTEKKDGI